MLKKYWKTAAHIVTLALAVLVLIIVCVESNQASEAIYIPFFFRGEYRQSDEDWLPLDENTQLSALEGDLVLRGSLTADIPEGLTLHFYLNHLEYSLYLNGEFIMCSSGYEGQYFVSQCAKSWASIVSPGIRTQDILEIHLHNPHRLGNADAYTEFLHSFHCGSTLQLSSMLNKENILYRGAGILIIILSIGIIGVAIASSAMRVSLEKQLWPLGLMSLFAGGYIILDTPDVGLWSKMMVFNTYAQQLCLMLAVLELGIFLTFYLNTQAKKIVQLTVWIQGVFFTVAVIRCLLEKIRIYDTLPFWIPMQILLCPVLFVCCIYEYRQKARENPAFLPASACILLAFTLDCLNIYFMWWTEGIVTKIVFIIFFVGCLAWGIREIPISYQNAIRVNTLVNDLDNSRSVLAASQIRTHFIFNILNAISGMCKYDPEKADQTIVRFARYLRTNIDIMQDDQPVPFLSTLQHLKDYVVLEQIRFGDKIRFITDITVSNFLLPPLVLQPIVENSIKHGLMPKPSGGTIVVRTWAEDGQIRISIFDDGVGFCPDTFDNNRCVGLANVRFRLQHMMHGSLKIESVPGQGTTVTISVPNKEAELCI